VPVAGKNEVAEAFVVLEQHEALVS
jgi:hypothetical protein